MPSTRTVAAGCSAAALLSLAGVATAQSPGVDTGLGLGGTLAARFVGSFLGLLLIAGLAVVINESYVRGRVQEIHRSAGDAFVWGLLVGIAVPIGLALLAITIIGLLVTIPGLLVIAIVSLVGQAVAVVWIGSLVTGDRERPGARAALVGALVLAVPGTIPVLGNFLLTLVGYFGTGVVGRRLYENW